MTVIPEYNEIYDPILDFWYVLGLLENVSEIILTLEETQVQTDPDDIPISPTYKAIVKIGREKIITTWYVSFGKRKTNLLEIILKISGFSISLNEITKENPNVKVTYHA